MGWMSEIHVRVQELGNYCAGSQLSLGGLQERIAQDFADLPPSILRGPDVDFVHQACKNERVTLEIVECLLAAFPEAARTCERDGGSPLHFACENKSMDPGIVRLLLDRWPESANHRNNAGNLPLHNLCGTSGSVDETASVAILDLLLKAAPQSAAELDRNGDLPIHFACKRGRSYPFCKRLIDADPASLRVQGRGGLPILLACRGGSVETVKYILELDPESIHARDGQGDLPIHQVVVFAGEESGKHIIRYLLTKDPDCASKTGPGQSLPLHVACLRNCLDTARLLFDAYPEAITLRRGRERRTPLDDARQRGGVAVIDFLVAQLVYARMAEDERAIATPDENGWLPLHRALRSGATMGAIKLLIAGNRDAVHVSDNQSAFPLHIACEFSTLGVVQHILRLSGVHLHAIDSWRDSPLHYACRGGNLDVVNHLLEQRVPSVSQPNRSGKLPIHLMWESNRVDRNSVDYVEAVWRLLLARPETVMH